MKAKVTRAYTDRLDGSVHYPNTTVELSADRLSELAGKGFVEAASGGDGGGGEPPEEGAADAPDLGAMTSAQLRDLIAERGGTAPKRATKAQLLEIAGSL